MAQTTQIFSEFQELMNKEYDLREDIRIAVRELEQTCREIMMELQTIHQQNGISKAEEICSNTRDMFDMVKQKFTVLSSKLGQENYYRFHEMWRFVMQKAAFLAAFIIYLQSERLATRVEVAQMLGVKVSRTDGFHIDLDDYLMALLTLASELSRLAVNAVTAGEYDQPFRIASFVAELDAGFRLLNLKNDALRKRFDSLKYSLKKVEEVVYDVTIRHLRPKEAAETKKTAGT